jgi:hypothetical protein
MASVPEIFIKVTPPKSAATDPRARTSVPSDLVDIYAVGKIMKWSWALNCVVGAAALLLPPTAAPDSHLQAQLGSAASSAAAHVNFKIVIPPVLYLHVASPNEGAADPRVAIMSNNHNVTLTATNRTPANTVAGTFILSAAARKIIAQEAVCTPSAGTHRGLGHGYGLVCTASIP